MTFVKDLLVNVVTALGTPKDKSAANVHALRLIPPQELEAAYRGDWLARKIVDIVPFDMTREWREWQAEDTEIEKLEAAERELRIRDKVARALQLARLYGGSAIYIGIAGTTDPRLPLNINTVRAGSIEYLHVLTPLDINVGAIDRDPLSPFYGEPAYYEIGQGRRVPVHPSRIIRFVGAGLPDPLRSNQVWGDSILQVVNDAVMAASSSQQHVASLIPEMKIDVVRIPGLSDELATEGGSARLIERFTLANTLKSTVNTLILEGEGEQGETWEQKQLNFSGLPDLLRMYLQIAAGAADIPVTRLLGQSPSGLNSTGESDIRNYYDHISARQNVELRPTLDRLDEILIRHALGTRPADIWYEFAPLWQLSEKEKAENDHKRAQTTDIYVKSGLFPQEALSKAVQNQLIETGTYPGLEQALEEAPEIDFEEQAQLELEAQASANTLQDAAPRSLYVSRPVVNAAEIIDWAKKQGFTTTLPAEDLHVTIAYSREPVDWMKVGNASEFGAKDGKLLIPRGGPRLVEPLGDKGAVVLLFSSMDLNWRHESILSAGASWDHDGYQPHITITYEPGDVDLSKVEPYTGPIILGPEKFAEVDENWAEKVKGRAA